MLLQLFIAIYEVQICFQLLLATTFAKNTLMPNMTPKLIQNKEKYTTRRKISVINFYLALFEVWKCDVTYKKLVY